TASIASVNADELPESASLSINNMIQGRVPGVDIVSSSGMPGSGVSIKIRGVSSINNSEPLYVIDGVQFFNSGGESFNVMSMINPQDIESIEILKDASAAAIYGANGANGVILITTKKGKKGRAKVTFKTQYGIAQTPKKLDLLGADEYVDLLIEQQQNYYPNSPLDEVVGPTVLDYEYSRISRTDWQDVVSRNAELYQADMSVSGGGENANYLFSMGYADQEAIVIGADFTRYTIRLASDFKLNDHISIGENMNILYTTRHDVGGAGSDLINGAFRMAPYVPIYDNGNWWGFGNNNNVNDNNNADNPMTAVHYRTDSQKDARIFGNVYANIDFIESLRYYVSFGFNFNNHYRNLFVQTHVNSNETEPQSLEENYSWGLNPLLEQTLTYDETFGDHSITLLGGMSVSRYGGGRSITVTGKNFPNEELDNILLAGDKLISDEDIWKSASLSYFTRLNYGFANKYLLTAIFRADASPNFAPQNRWGYFPALSAAWKLQEEDFIKDNAPSISNLKLRVGWGKNGISNIGAYQYLSYMHSRGMTYPVGIPGAEQYLAGTTIKALASPDIKWEEATTTNIGLDVGLMNNRLTFTVDYFDKITDNILVSVPTSPSMGLGLAGGAEGGSRIANAASAKNNGLEFSATYSNYDSEFKYNISGNITYVTNEVTSLGAGEPITGPQYNGQAAITLTDEGHPIGSFYGFKVDKVYANQAEVDADNQLAQQNGADYYQNDATSPGDIRFVDVDNSGFIDDEDRDFIGSPIPKYTYGISFDANYKGWDFATTLTGVADVDIYSAFYTWNLEGMRVTGNHTTYVRDRWTTENTTTDVPRAISADPSNNLRTSDRYISDGAFAKLRNLSLGYSIPAETLSSLNLSSVSKLRVYASAQNLFTLSSYKGLDPEVAAMSPGDLNGYNLGRGIDDGFTPHPRIFMFGVEVVF
ncbi:MAG TPA: SusC/RagA family TonB-linked outer membrane protein, partial [Prolixibacteraceae bacterium]|nr:SusC/RagA family TonB-linked outer membrane protein [Prolixibacteraceae bacterium]